MKPGLREDYSLNYQAAKHWLQPRSSSNAAIVDTALASVLAYSDRQAAQHKNL